MADRRGLVQVPTAAVRALAESGHSNLEVFLPQQGERGPVLYHRDEMGAIPLDVKRMLEHGVSHVFVNSCDFQQCEQALEEHLTSILSNPALEPGDKATIAHTAGAAVARDLTEREITSDELGRVNNLVDALLASVLTDPHVSAHLVDMAGHERGTASHMFIVSSLAVMFGAELFGPKSDILRALGVAGMLHDLGKLSIPAEVLQQAAPLSRAQLEMIRQHPIESVRLIGEDPNVCAEARQMILQHHERIDGQGYPLGLNGRELMEGSKVLSIVDAFHAMIGRRSYRSSLKPAEANRIMATQADKQFDAEMLAMWTALCNRWGMEPVSRIAASGGNDTSEEDDIARHEHRPTTKLPNRIDRRQTRHECNGQAMVSCIYVGRLPRVTQTPESFNALVQDISRRGLSILHTYPMYRGEVVNLRVRVSTGFVWVQSTVAWCRRKDENVFRIGLRFLERIEESKIHDRVPVLPLEITEGITLPPTQAKSREVNQAEVTDDENEPLDRRQQAMETLAAIESLRKADRNSQQTAVTLAMAGDHNVRLRALEVMIAINGTLTRQGIVSLLSDTNSEIRLRAAKAAGAHHIRDAIGALKEMLRDPEPRVALAAAGALGRLADESGLGLATRWLMEDSPDARFAAVAIGEITGHTFSANREGIQSARRYVEAKKLATA